MPIWTRKIAAEVIPGVIRPLTWSINRPLTCGVWGDLFTTVLKARAADLDFEQTATLHQSYAYFNATLLGEIFTRMGLPPESLEFLTRGAKFSKPPLGVTLKNAPGLMRLLAQEMSLPKRFAQAQRQVFRPAMEAWDAEPVEQLSNDAIAQRIQDILDLLQQVTYYNILAPLSLALRQAIFKVDLATLDSSRNPEVSAIEALKQIAQLSESEQKEPFEQFLSDYGYLSEVATDIAVPTWKESPQPLYDLLAQYRKNPRLAQPKPASQPAKGWKQKQVQARLDLKGQVAEVYDRLLAMLRGCFVTVEDRWLRKGGLSEQGDIFFLTWDEVRTELTAGPQDAVLTATSAEDRKPEISHRRVRWTKAYERTAPNLVYGQPPANNPTSGVSTTNAFPTLSSGTLQGIGASAGEVEGTILVMTQLSGDTNLETDVSNDTVLVVPYTDAGWSPVLAQIGGLIAEVGGQLSHGAIVAREYGIPAVMDVTDATARLTNGQRVRIDGQRGTIKIL